MIEQKLVPNIDLFRRIQHTKLNSQPTLSSFRMSRIEKPETNNFKAVMSGLVENLNQELNAPDKLMKELAMGSSSVDVHDVMTAVAKSEMGVTLATQVTGKILSAYERVMQIQI